jgi:hypothetical protein
VPTRAFARVLVAMLAVAVSLVAPSDPAMAGIPPSTSAPVESVPAPTVNEFLPEDRSIGECISAVPKPGCGSESRGGWRQYLVAIALVGGLVIVGWRIVSGVRRRPATG